LSHVLYASGYRLDVEAIGALCRDRGVHFHVDATQSLGVVPTDVKKAKIDFLSVGAYKWLLSPLGSGFFYIDKKFLDRSPVLGWLSVENAHELDVHNHEILDGAGRFEIGNLDVGAFLGMAAALDLINSIGVKEIEKRAVGLSTHLIEELNGLGLEVISDFEKEHLSGIVSFLESGITKEDLIKNKIVATVRDHIRFSPHIYNTKEEISRAVEIIGKLRR
jgi:selenocysteine lyase/cysteine desulfurase